ncbi:ATP-binding protein [Candidatus Enterococcus ferrettii]|uniref:ATPase domain-containing protein n=1 Tax=Candidatus Enterococcus ferrettii TaxID=2815324 RepID=A0ABV0ET79_9ENTE|nr:ATP-binding protein [Enterococcus sp. 665A]MBO1340217.1 ATP-binding protein [Enterococcus sp. 665A]
MFIGRQKQLARMEQLYNSDKFEFLALYGKRRIGKTTLISEFSKDKDVIFFTAKETNDTMNLRAFSRLLLEHFEHQLPRVLFLSLGKRPLSG